MRGYESSCCVGLTLLLLLWIPIFALGQESRGEDYAENAAICGYIYNSVASMSLQCKGSEFEELGGIAYQAGGALGRSAQAKAPESAMRYVLKFVIRNDKKDQAETFLDQAPACYVFVKNNLLEINADGEKYQISPDIDLLSLTKAIVSCSKK